MPSESVMSAMTSDYNDLNQSQSTVWQHVRPLLESIMDDQQEHTHFRVADLGCATGGNSLAPLRYIASRLSPGSIYEVFLCDLPSNSWATLVSTVTPAALTSSPDTTFVHLVGRTFYDACTPPNTLHLSYSLVAVHWMESHAGDLPDGLYATDALHVPDSAMLAAWRAAAARDWRRFVQARHRELQPGGRFLGVVACPKENGDCPWSRVGHVIYREMRQVVSHPDALAACVLPCSWRTKEEVRAGFTANDDDGSSEWEIETCVFHQTKDPVREELDQGKITAKEYGAAIVQSFRSVCHPTLVGVMSKYMPQSQAEEELEQAYVASIDDVAANPERLNLDVSFWYIVAKKTSAA